MRLVTGLFVCVYIASFAGFAHDLPLDRTMNGFVKIDQQQAHLVLRVPLDLLNVVQFPLGGADYDVAHSGPAIERALGALAHDVSVRENGEVLVPSSAVGRLAPTYDRSFQEYEQAKAEVSQPSDPAARIHYGLGYFDAHFTYPIHSPRSVFTLENRVAEDLNAATKLALRYLPPGESGRAMLIPGGSGSVFLNPPWYVASRAFIVLGIEHILSGIDHLLFLLCLIIPFRRLKGLIPVITAFTVGHSITLIGAAYDMAPTGAWFPPFVETAIAVSIFYMAVENIAGAKLGHRWIIAGLFGLVHGFGFSSAIKQQLQFSGSHLLASLFSFNVGIEIGQLGVLCLLVPALHLLFRGALAGRMGIVVLSAIVAHQAWHWALDRGAVLMQVPWPHLTRQGVLGLLQLVVVAILAVAGATLLAKRIERRLPRVRPAAPRVES
jgi:HupE / UreJ protein